MKLRRLFFRLSANFSNIVFIQRGRKEDPLGEELMVYAANENKTLSREEQTSEAKQDSTGKIRRYLDLADKLLNQQVTRNDNSSAA